MFFKYEKYGYLVRRRSAIYIYIYIYSEHQSLYVGKAGCEPKFYSEIENGKGSSGPRVLVCFHLIWIYYTQANQVWIWLILLALPNSESFFQKHVSHKPIKSRYTLDMLDSIGSTKNPERGIRLWFRTNNRCPGSS